MTELPPESERILTIQPALNGRSLRKQPKVGAEDLPELINSIDPDVMPGF